MEVVNEMIMSERGKRILSFIIAMAFILTGFVYSPKSAEAADAPQVSVLGASLRLESNYNSNGTQSMRIAITVANASKAKSCSIDLTVGSKKVTIATDGEASATRLIHDKLYSVDRENDSVVYAVTLSNIPQSNFSTDVGIQGHAETIVSDETKSSDSVVRTVEGIVSGMNDKYPALNISLVNGILCKNNGNDKLTAEDLENYVEPTAGPANDIWVATWGTAEEKCDTTDTAMPQMALEGSTVRQIIKVTTSGNKMKLKLSNQYGQSAVEVQSLHVAKQVKADESTIDTSTDTVVKVNGSESFSIPAGQTIETDPVDFSVNALENVAISMYFGSAPTSNITGHRGARATTYQMSGNNVSTQTLSSYKTTTSWFFLADVSLMQPENAKAVVCFGDSITDGYGTDAGYLGKKPDSYTRWGDYFAKRLQANASTKNISVINEGIGANSMMGSYPTDAGKDRFARDLLEHDGVGYCIVLFGVNDLNKLSDTSKYNQLKPEYEKMVALAHANGIKIYAAPILPFGTSDYYSDASEQVRTMLNNWMRSEESGFDGIIDFESALADPANPKNIKYEYTLDDGLHPYEGYDVMANAIDLTMFDGTYVRPTAAPTQTPIPPRETTTIEFNPDNIVVVGGPEGAKATLGSDGSVSYEYENGFSGLIIPLPDNYEVGNEQSFYVTVDYESVGCEARAYLLVGTADNGVSNIIGADPSPLSGQLTANANGADHIFIKASSWDTKFTSLKVNSITLSDNEIVITPSPVPTRDPATNLVTNGDFSNGNTGWTSNYGGYTPTVVDGYGVYNGRWNCYASATYTINRRFAAGDVVEFAFDVKLAENYAENGDVSFAYWFADAAGTESNKEACYDANGNRVYGNAEGWTRVEGSYTVPAYTEKLTIYIGEGPGYSETRNAEFHIDNLHVSTENDEPAAATATPVPTEAPELGEVITEVDITKNPSANGATVTKNADGSVTATSAELMLFPIDGSFKSGDEVYVTVYGEASNDTPRVWISEGAWTARTNIVSPYTFGQEVKLTFTADCSNLSVQVKKTGSAFDSITINRIVIRQEGVEIVAPTPTPVPRDTITMNLDPANIRIIGGTDGATATLNTDGSVIYEKEGGFNGMMIPLPEEYVLASGQSLYITVNYESVGCNARAYLLTGTDDNAASNIISASPSPLQGLLTATEDGANYVFIKASAYNTTFTSLKINSITLSDDALE